VAVGYDKAVIKDAPNISDDGHLSPEDEQRLYRHYNLDYGTSDRGGKSTSGDVTAARGTSGRGRHAYPAADLRDERDDVQDGTRGQDTSGPTTDRAMTRSEERLKVGTETREAGRARLRKHVMTEHQQVSVPVSREEVRVERGPITDANREPAHDGPAISEEEHEVVLREERPVVDTEAVAVERVKLGTETVHDEETVSGDVRKEEVELDDDAGTTDTARDTRY
jgi:uncharacterized protein (TIGR02271 family)